jgi:hypothetical protein
MESEYDLLARLADDDYDPPGGWAVKNAEIAAVMARVDSAESFERLATLIDLEIAGALKGFAYSMATLALRSRDSAPVIQGLIAAQLVMMADDPRDALVTYSLLYRSAEEIGLDASEVFRSNSLMPSGEFQQTPAEFAKRDPAIRNISAMGMMLVEGPEGPTYQQKAW